MKKFRNVPAIMTLTAGFVTSVVMIVGKYALVTFLWVLVLVMAGFYIAGLLICLVLNRVFNPDQKEEQEETDETEENAKTDAQGDSDEP